MFVTAGAVKLHSVRERVGQGQILMALSERYARKETFIPPLDNSASQRAAPHISLHSLCTGMRLHAIVSILSMVPSSNACFRPFVNSLPHTVARSLRQARFIPAVSIVSACRRATQPYLISCRPRNRPTRNIVRTLPSPHSSL